MRYDLPNVPDIPKPSGLKEPVAAFVATSTSLADDPDPTILVLPNRDESMPFPKDSNLWFQPSDLFGAGPPMSRL